MGRMVASNNPYGRDERDILQEIAGQEQEAERSKQQEREAHVRNLKAASRLIDALNHNASAFKKSGILYCLEKEQPPFAPTICLFRRHKSGNPEMIFIPVNVDGPHGTFSLRSLVKRKKSETLKWVTHRTKLYEERLWVSASLLPSRSPQCSCFGSRSAAGNEWTNSVSFLRDFCRVGKVGGRRTLDPR